MSAANAGAVNAAKAAAPSKNFFMFVPLVTPFDPQQTTWSQFGCSAALPGATDVFIVTSLPHFGFHPTRKRRLAHWRLGYVAGPRHQVHFRSRFYEVTETEVI